MRDPYEAMRALCRELEEEGVAPELIIDAMQVVSLNAGAAMEGPAFVAAHCLRMAEVFKARAEQRVPPSNRMQ